MLHHTNSSVEPDARRSASGSSRHRKDRDYQRSRQSSGTARIGLQLLGPDEYGDMRYNLYGAVAGWRVGVFRRVEPHQGGSAIRKRDAGDVRTGWSQERGQDV